MLVGLLEVGEHAVAPDLLEPVVDEHLVLRVDLPDVAVLRELDEVNVLLRKPKRSGIAY